MSAHLDKSFSTRLVIVGYGRMGKLVESLAPEFSCQVVGVLDEAENAAGAGLTDAMARAGDGGGDFNAPDPVRHNIGRYCALKLNAVIGTTGWTSDRTAL